MFMKKLLFVLVLVLLMVFPAFAANEYTQVGASYGYSPLLESPTFGFHSLYQFGASFSDDFELGFGTDVELDIATAATKTDFVSVDVILGLAAAVNLDDNIAFNITAGPCLNACGKIDDEDAAAAAVGFGASAGITLIPTGELDDRVQLGFTFGATGEVLWSENTDLLTKKFTGFVALTLRGPMMFASYDYVPSNIVW